MTTSRLPRPAPRAERGFVLVTAMLFLIVLTMLVFALMRTSILEEKMVGASRDWNIAFQAAEAALRGAEKELDDGKIMGKTGFVEGCSTGSKAGLCLPNECKKSDETDCTPVWIVLEQDAEQKKCWVKGNCSGAGQKSAAYGTPLPGVAAQPRYIIEALNLPGVQLYYRITAVGFGATTATRVRLQSTFVLKEDEK
jgi:type IV pilus assembly protein PilX